MANSTPTENILMPELEMRSASMFHSITRIPVNFSTEVKDKEIYPQGNVKVGDNWLQTYALTGAGIAKLITAAGIAVRKDDDYRTDDRSHPHVCSWHWTGEWRQPDGTLLVLAGDYTMDLRDWIDTPDGKIRGPRFEQIRQGKMESILYGVANKQKANIPRSKDERTEFFNTLFLSLPEDERKQLDERADRSAILSLIEMRPHITARAQTGAMLRAVRKLLQLKSAYTLEELKRPFVVYRSSFRFEEMAKALGPIETQRLVLAAAANYLGITAAQLKELPPGHEEQASPDASATEPEKTTESEQKLDDVHIPAEAEKTASPPASDQTLENKPAPEEPAPPENEFHKPIPWRGNEVALITERVDPVKDKALIDRAPRFIKPKAHLLNHIKSHYHVERWTEMTLGQGLLLWGHLDELEFADAKEAQ